MKNKEENKRYFLIVVYGLFLVLAFGAGFFWEKKLNANRKEIIKEDDIKEIRQSGYKFINPLLECEVESNSPILKSSELKIKKIIQEDIINKNPDAEIAFYYRDLKNGPTFGINEQSQYSPASLLKVPLMITYYKYAESDPGIFDKEMKFDRISEQFNQSVEPIEKIEPGKSYTVRELIEAMIINSDNEATNLLFQNIKEDDLNSIFNDLGLSAPDIYNPNNSISVKDYASFFRILYNSSYIDRQSSEEALNILSKVNYKKGLVAGVSSEINIAHKFGERESRNDKGEIIRQLHDCGIVYYPNRPYLICVMTRGRNFENLTNIISQISNVIYKEVDNMNNN